MIKNERLISTMTLKERIRLIAGFDSFKSCSPGTFEFPLISLEGDPLSDKGVFATRFPSERALAAAFDPSVVQRVYRAVGEEANACVPYAYYNVSNRFEKTAVSNEPHVAAAYLRDKVGGLLRAGTFVNFDNEASEDDAPALKETTERMTDGISDGNLPLSTLYHGDAEGKPVGKELRYGTAADKESFARCLKNGCSLVFLLNDIFEELVPYVTSLTEGYERMRKIVQSGRIDADELTRREEALEILNPARIENACDRLIEAFVRMRQLCENAAAGARTVADPANNHDPLFDEQRHDAVALEAARGSVVLLKNEGVLPLKSKDRIAVVGECAKNEAYAAWGNTSTVTRLAFDAVNDYEIKTVGYAHGYLRGESGRADLPNTAGILCSEADYALVWLSAESGAYALPDGQVELIDALYRRGIKVIAAVEADGIIDMSFCDKCAAVLFGYRGGQRFADAVYEIVSGKVCPSGRLTEPFPTEIEVKEDGGIAGKGGVLYPFGYGLSYTSFSYSNLRITDAGVTCTVTNTGSGDGYDTLFLYVRKSDGEKGTAKKALRGYQKVFVRKSDAVKVFIPFDEGTFRTYSEKRKKFCIEGGKYGVYLASNGGDVRLAGEISIEGRVFDERTFTVEKEVPQDFDKAYGDFMKTRDATKKKNAHTLPLGVKIAIALFVALYADGLAAVCITTGVLESLGNLRLLIFIGIAAVFDLVALVYIIRVLRLRSVLSPAETPKKWSEAIDTLGDFREIAKVSYEEPISEGREEEEEEAEEETQTPDEPLSYDNAFTEKGAENIAFKDDVHFGDLCADFKRFMNARGVEIEMPSVRAIFAALASGNLVLMQVKNKEMLADFMDAMSMYFNDAALMNASNDWASVTDVLWMKVDGKYVASPLLDALYSAIANPHKNGMAIINNVSVANLRNYFSDFIRFALHPTEEHVLKVNDTTTTTLPLNMRYVLIMQEGAFANIPRYLANASVQISPVIGKTSIAGTKPETLSISRMAFNNLVQSVREEKYLSESVWKKIDALAEVIGKSEKFVLGNKNTIRLEKFTSVLLECGADESEALMGAFTAKLVPLLKTLDMYASEDGESAVFGMIEKIFPDEELSKVRHALMKGPAKEDVQ